MDGIGGYPLRNAEGYMDTTAHKALNRMQTDAEEADLRANRLIKIIKNLVDLAGFDLTERIVITDRKTGRIYK